MDEPTKKVVQIKNTYCVTHAERNANIVSAMSRIKKKIEPGTKQTAPMAIVGYGPSLNQTWEQIRDFPYIMSMSGSHAFLVERGIIPTHHIEVDPREHKARMLGFPQEKVKYYIAADCHPAVFDHLEGYDVSLWQILSEELELQELWEEGDYALAGGTGVGSRALVLAKFLGFSDLHLFGIDGSFGDSGSHASLHTNAPPMDEVVEVEETGRRFKTTSAMLGAVHEFGDQLDALPGTSFTFYGDGLIQWCASRYVPRVWEPGHVPVLAIKKIPKSESDHKGILTVLDFVPKPPAMLERI